MLISTSTCARIQRRDVFISLLELEKSTIFHVDRRLNSNSRTPNKEEKNPMEGCVLASLDVRPYHYVCVDEEFLHPIDLLISLEKFQKIIHKIAD